MSKMLKFVDLKRQTPEKIASGERKENFLEIYKEFINNKAEEQASRCSQCGTPFLPSSLSFAKQYSRLVKIDCRGKIKRCLRNFISY